MRVRVRRRVKGWSRKGVCVREKKRESARDRRVCERECVHRLLRVEG